MALLVLGLGSGCAHRSAESADYAARNRLEPDQKPRPVDASTPRPPEEGPEVAVQSERARYELTPDGRLTYTYELTYRLLRLRDGSSWQAVEASWAPAHQEAPVLSARVVAPDGTVRNHEGLEGEVETLTGRDVLGRPRRRVVARIPGLEAGALVEQRVQRISRASPLAAGVADRFYFGMGAPVPRSAVELRVPLGLPVAVELRGLEIEPEVAETDTHRTFTYRAGPLSPNPPPSPLLRADEVPSPYLAFSTTPSWEPIVRAMRSRLGRAGRSRLRLPVRGRTDAAIRAAVRAVRELANPDDPERLGPFETVDLAQASRERGGTGWARAAVLADALTKRGLSAAVALARSAPGEDIRPDLPSLTGFDRAVVKVRRGDRAPLWLDPSSQLADLLRLPSDLHGRWALVLDQPGDRPDLERLPPPDPAASTYYEERRFSLPSYGRARVVELTRATGGVAERLRAQVRRSARRRRLVEGYVDNQYGGDLGDLEVSSDWAEPVQVELEVLDARAGRVELHRAQVALSLAPLFGWLPPVVRDAALAPAEPEDDAGRRRRIAAAYVVTREGPVVLPRPYSAELRFEIDAPPGFEPVDRPPDRRLRLGPAEFSSSFVARPGGLTAIMRFDSGPAEIAADELRALVAGLRNLWSEPAGVIELRHRATLEATEGDVGESLRRFAEIARDHPRDCGARARLALALLEAGLGGSARRTAREAVDLDRESVLARLALGRALAHDLVGRRHAPGFDREGAIEALRTVKVLDPAQIEARVELAALRAMNDRGVRHADRAGIEAAVAEYRSLKQETGIAAFDEALLEALFHADRDEELLIEAEKMKRSLRRDGLALAARSRLDGDVGGSSEVFAALGLPERLQPMVRAVAAGELVKVRGYGLARALLEPVEAEGAKDELPSAVERLMQLRTAEEVLRDPDDPVRVVQDVLRVATRPSSSAEDYLPLLSGQQDPAFARVHAERLAKVFEVVAQRAQSSKLPASLYADTLFSNAEFEVSDGEGPGRMVVLDVEGLVPIRFFVHDEQPWRIVASSLAGAGLGVAALEALARGEPAVAKGWLRMADGLHESLRAEAPEDRFEDAPYVQLRRRHPAALRPAALVLAALAPSYDAGRARLEAALDELPDGPIRAAAAHGLAVALAIQDRPEASLATLRGLLGAHPESDALRAMEVSLLLRLGRFDAARPAARARLARRPDHIPAMMQLANVELARGSFDRAAQLFQDAVDQEATAAALNNLAWTALFRGEVSERDVELARAANAITRNRSAVELHTLASVLAERGDVTEATKTLRRRLEVLGAEEPESIDYYIIGRVLEHVGLERLSREAYAKVEPESSGRADDTHILAARSLRRLRGR